MNDPEHPAFLATTVASHASELTAMKESHNNALEKLAELVKKIDWLMDVVKTVAPHKITIDVDKAVHAVAEGLEAANNALNSPE